jgi:hypothetical protein
MNTYSQKINYSFSSSTAVLSICVVKANMSQGLQVDELEHLLNIMKKDYG